MSIAFNLRIFFAAFFPFFFFLFLDLFFVSFVFRSAANGRQKKVWKNVEYAFPFFFDYTMCILHIAHTDKFHGAYATIFILCFDQFDVFNFIFFFLTSEAFTRREKKKTHKRWKKNSRKLPPNTELNRKGTERTDKRKIQNRKECKCFTYAPCLLRDFYACREHFQYIVCSTEEKKIDWTKRRKKKREKKITMRCKEEKKIKLLKI